MLAHGTGLCYIEEAFHAFYKEALGLTKLSARERVRIGLLALIIAAAVLFFCGILLLSQQGMIAERQKAIKMRIFIFQRARGCWRAG